MNPLIEKLFEEIRFTASKKTLKEITTRQMQAYAPITYQDRPDMQFVQIEPDLKEMKAFVEKRTDKFKGFALIDVRGHKILKFYPVESGDTYSSN